MTLVIGFLIGCAFGAILYLGGASSYRRILGTLLLELPPHSWHPAT